MGVLEELQREHLARTVPEPDEASDALTAPRVGQVWRDGLNPAFTWRVQHIGAESVFLRMRDADGVATDAYLDWKLDRWGALVAKQGLVLVSGGD